jgi:hypothetical protein
MFKYAGNGRYVYDGSRRADNSHDRTVQLVKYKQNVLGGRKYDRAYINVGSIQCAVPYELLGKRIQIVLEVV